MEDEEAYGPGDSALAVMYEYDAGPDVYAGMDVDPDRAAAAHAHCGAAPSPGEL